MKTLLTGATGFIGKYLARKLKAEGHQCRCLVRSREKAEQVPDLEGTELVEGDITEPASLSGVAHGIDTVFHLAGIGHVSATSEEAYRRFTEINVHGARNMVQACAGQGVARFVHFGSTAAMGLIQLPTIADEETACNPATPYQRSKLLGEIAVLEAAQETSVPTVIVRPCMVIGAGGEGEFLKMARLMSHGRFPRVGRGENFTPVIHVQDVVDGAVLAAEEGMPGETYLLIGGSFPMDEIRHLVVKTLGTSPLYPYVPVWLVLLGAWGLETMAQLTGRTPLVSRRNIASTVADRVFSIEKAKRHLGFVPQVSLEEAIADAVTWYKAQELL